MDKLTLAVVFGGQSSEHEISCLSAATIIRNINKEAYELLLIGITREGRWLLAKDLEDVVSGAWKNSDTEAVISPEATIHGAVLIKDGVSYTKHVDVIFPALHGLYGEDGTIQGIFEMAHIPYVGCGVLASAVGMDKFYTKIIVDRLGIAQAKYVPVYREELSDMEAVVARIEAAHHYPIFVKPSNAGSSKGVSKAADRESLKAALAIAAAEDYKILVEETIVGRELECALFGGEMIEASGVGEVLAADEFYSYDAKYNNSDSRTELRPDLPAGKEEEIRTAAMRIFKAIDGFGLSRADFFLEKGTNRVVFNEINTLPGFTSISMYPMLWAERGVSTPELVEKLIRSAWRRKSSRTEEK